MKFLRCKAMLSAAVFALLSMIGSRCLAEEKPITIVLAEHVPNVEEQAPQVWKIAQAYMALHPNVAIEIEGASANDHVNKMLMAAQSGTLPDIFWMRRGYAMQMAEQGYLADLTSIVDEDEAFKNGFLDGMLDVVKLDDHIYGFPYELQCNGLWYNEAIFEANGLAVPVTYEDYLNCATVLSAKGIPFIAKGMKNNMVWSFQTMLCRFGYYDKIDAILNGTEKWNNPDFVRFYEKVAALRDAGAFPDNTAVIEYWNAIELFLSGNAAMLDSGAWDTSKIETSELDKSKIGFTWGPTFSDGIGNQEISMKAVSHPFVVSAQAQQDSEKFAVIADFLKFYYGYEGSRIIVEEVRAIPVTNYEFSVDADTAPIFNLMMSKVRDDWASPALCPDYYLPIEMYSPLSDSIGEVITGISTPEEALDHLDQLMLDTGTL